MLEELIEINDEGKSQNNEQLNDKVDELSNNFKNI